MRCHPDFCEHFHPSDPRHGYCTKRDERLWVTPGASCARSRVKAPGCKECEHWTPTRHQWGSCAQGVTEGWFAHDGQVSSGGWCEAWSEMSEERRLASAHEAGRLF